MSEFAGHLELECAARADERSFISRQSFRAPFHISKSYWDDYALMVQVINPTAGLFAGDRLRSSVTVQTRARLHLTTPSATRVHTMPEGHAELTQEFHVEAGGWLEYSPAPLLPQTGCRYRQRTHIMVEPGGELFFVEMLTPGRVARGESFAFAELDCELDLTWPQELIARERFRLRPAAGDLQALRRQFPDCYSASCYLLTSRVDNDHVCWRQIRQLNTLHLLLGVSRLAKAGWSIKILARDSVSLRQAMTGLREILALYIHPLGGLRGFALSP